MEAKRIALEEKRLQADKERHGLFADVVAQQQQQQAWLIQQQKMTYWLIQQQQQQKMVTELQVQNSQVELKLLKVLRDIKDK